MPQIKGAAYSILSERISPPSFLIGQLRLEARIGILATKQRFPVPWVGKTSRMGN